MADNTPNIMVNPYKIEADRKAEEIKNKAKKKEEEKAEKQKKLKEATDKSYGSKMVKQKESLDKAKVADVREKIASTPDEKKKFTEEKKEALEEHTTPVYAGETKEVMEKVQKGEAPGLPGSEARAENALKNTPTILDDPEVQKTDEGQLAKEIIETKDISKAENIVDQNTGKPAVDPVYDENGNVIDFKELVPENAELYSKGTAIGLTVLSAILFFLSGGRFPPINFVSLRWDEAKNKEAEMKNELLRQYNKGAEQNLMNEVQNKQTQERLNLAEANKEKIPAYGQLQEAEAGGTGYQQAALNADLQKAIKGMDIENSQTLLKMTNEQQKNMARLLFDQETSKPVAEYIKMVDANVDPDTLAKFKRAYQGVTSVEKAFQYLDGIIGSAAQGVTAGVTAGFLGNGARGAANAAASAAANAANSNMLRNARKGKK
ncbi:MAG: hypothetical protein II411_02705 [Lachnospiraceae bacterium]|nr:hypothetical protein [Lachnospiraceae bacterium]